MRCTTVLLALLMITGCATGPKFDLTGVDRTLTPARAASNVDMVRGQRVLWGGVIVASRNLADQTQLEVLGYPLNRSGKPNRDDPPQHRFIVRHPGYLETADYAEGRLVSIVGKIDGTQDGKVGEARYVYPVVAGTELHLWPREVGYARQNEPQVHFGVGVIFGR